MLNDYKMIVHKLPKKFPYINLYPLADVHLGSQETNLKAFQDFISMVKEDEYGFVVIAGDMMNMGLKNSKTNSYEETMRPREQKEFLFESLLPIKDKILASVGGNHEYRGTKEADSDPLYDVMCRLQIEDRYRQNACFVKINLGTSPKDPNKQVSYGVVITHGTTRAKHDKFINGIDGADIFISGHTHDDEYKPNAKIRMDMSNEVVRFVPYRKIVCTPFQELGGYALRDEHSPRMVDEFQVLKLNGKQKKVNFFTV